MLEFDSEDANSGFINARMLLMNVFIFDIQVGATLQYIYISLLSIVITRIDTE